MSIIHLPVQISSSQENPDDQGDCFVGPCLSPLKTLLRRVAGGFSLQIWPETGSRLKNIARVAIPVPIHEAFDYRIPDEMLGQIVPGTPVLVPFGPSRRYGWVIETTDHSVHPKLRKIHSVVEDGATLSEELLTLLDWTANYYVCGIGEAIETALPKPVRERKVRQVRWVRGLEGARPDEKGGGADARNRVLEFLQQHPKPVPLRRLVEECGISDSPIKTLAKKGRIEILARLRPASGR